MSVVTAFHFRACEIYEVVYCIVDNFSPTTALRFELPVQFLFIGMLLLAIGDSTAIIYLTGLFLCNVFPA